MVIWRDHVRDRQDAPSPRLVRPTPTTPVLPLDLCDVDPLFTRVAVRRAPGRVHGCVRAHRFLHQVNPCSSAGVTCDQAAGEPWLRPRPRPWVQRSAGVPSATAGPSLVSSDKHAFPCLQKRNLVYVHLGKLLNEVRRITGGDATRAKQLTDLLYMRAHAGEKHELSKASSVRSLSLGPFPWVPAAYLSLLTAHPCLPLLTLESAAYLLTSNPCSLPRWIRWQSTRMPSTRVLLHPSPNSLAQ